MIFKDVVDLLQAEVLVPPSDDTIEIEIVHASDLISKVLASCSMGALWLTGLLDAQIVNTAELFDLIGVVFIGGRRPGREIIQAAEGEGIPILLTQLSMFEAAGILYANGLKTAKRD